MKSKLLEKKEGNDVGRWRQKRKWWV